MDFGEAENSVGGKLGDLLAEITTSNDVCADSVEIVRKIREAE